MDPATFARFDATALHAAIDARRRARGISWAQMAREGGPSVSTIANMAKDGLIEADGVFCALRWLGAPAEAFLRRDGEPPPAVDAFADAGPPPRQGRFANRARVDTAALFAALDARRVELDLSWTEVAREIGALRPEFWKRLGSGTRTEIHLYMRLVQWLGAPASTFVRSPGDPAYGPVLEGRDFRGADRNPLRPTSRP